jgi:hypothetical protein
VAIAQLYAVTETVGTTEWSFTTDTAGPDADATDGVFQGFFDVSAIANGDTFRFRLYESVLSGGTQRVVYEAVLTDAQMEPIFVTPSVILLHSWDMTWTKLGGTDRSIIGSIRSVA